VPPGYTLLSLTDVGIFEEIPEPGTSIRENSYLKAKYVADKLAASSKSLSVFADDSGLEVEALGGEPGVYSARYAGLPKSDVANNKKLLQALLNVTQRKARFVTVIALIYKNDVFYFEGEVTGTIAYQASGQEGFGYDPLFIPTGYRSTFADLGAEVKNTISHRAKATQQLLAFLKEQKF
jgi:XTP/dITP diphosphohydrolase